jgi:nitrogen regulatory protein PII
MEAVVAKQIIMEQVNNVKDFLTEAGIHNPTIGIVLGTGLHQLLNFIDIKKPFRIRIYLAFLYQQ